MLVYRCCLTAQCSGEDKRERRTLPQALKTVPWTQIFRPNDGEWSGKCSACLLYKNWNCITIILLFFFFSFPTELFLLVVQLWFFYAPALSRFLTRAFSAPLIKRYIKVVSQHSSKFLYVVNLSGKTPDLLTRLFGAKGPEHRLVLLARPSRYILHFPHKTNGNSKSKKIGRIFKQIWIAGTLTQRNESVCGFFRIFYKDHRTNTADMNMRVQRRPADIWWRNISKRLNSRHAFLTL